jgi:hypothetical protein
VSIVKSRRIERVKAFFEQPISFVSIHACIALFKKTK